MEEGKNIVKTIICDGDFMLMTVIKELNLDFFYGDILTTYLSNFCCIKIKVI